MPADHPAYGTSRDIKSVRVQPTEADIRRTFDISPLQWARSRTKAAKRTGGRPEVGLVLMIALCDLRKMTSADAMELIKSEGRYGEQD